MSKLIDMVPKVMADEKLDYYQASTTKPISKDNIASWSENDLEY